jgi:hypothetical protein
MNGFYSVFAPGGKKIADCGSLQDATTLVAMKGDIVDVSPRNQLPTRDIVVNMDGGVGGSWEVKSEPVLEESDEEVFVP